MQRPDGLSHAKGVGCMSEFQRTNLYDVNLNFRVEMHGITLYPQTLGEISV
jgi:hypothetical protein